MTREQLNAEVFYVDFDSKKIESCTYAEYLDEFGSDETTSPRGVEDRLHIRSIIRIKTPETIEEYEQEFGSEHEAVWFCKKANIPIESIVNESMYEVWSWGAGGNHPYCVTTFDNEEDANLYLYECEEEKANENCNAPAYYNNREEAVNDLAESANKSVEVVERYLALKAITERKKAERIAEIEKRNENRKMWLAVEVPKEAATIEIDDQFKSAIAWAGSASGTEKSNRMASAVKGLLQRNNKEKIESDFWQVARILKARV